MKKKVSTGGFQHFSCERKLHRYLLISFTICAVVGCNSHSEVVGKWSLKNVVNKCADQSMQEEADRITNNTTHRPYVDVNIKESTITFTGNNHYFFFDPDRAGITIVTDSSGTYKQRNNELTLYQNGVELFVFKIVSLDTASMLLQYKRSVLGVQCITTNYYDKTK